jgi:alanine transaminase
MMNPDLEHRCEFKSDVLARAKRYMGSIPTTGVYTQSQGIMEVREDVAAFLEKRDGFKANIDDIFLTNGASEGVKHCMQAFVRDPAKGIRDGVLAPIPQYPLYSAVLTLLGGKLVPYFLDEANNWECSFPDLKKSLRSAREQGVTVRGMVVINPGNPTGQVMSEESMIDIVKFCKQESITLMADEVYQENIYRPGVTFKSFRKLAYEMDVFEGKDPFQLISFHSSSKGFTGECGLRGGFFEMLGFPDDVKAQIVKLASISLCPNVVGQVTTGLMVAPPEEGDDSYPQWIDEKTSIMASLKRRALMLSAALNKMEGMSCNSIDGAMYAFPTITLPAKLVAYAREEMNVEPDAYYCMELLEKTGLVVVPGSGFGQEVGTWHFRTTFLPPEHDMEEVVRLLSEFNTQILEKFRD